MKIVRILPEELAPSLGKSKGLKQVDVTKALRRVNTLRVQGKATKARLKDIFESAGFDEDEVAYLVKFELGV